DHHHQVIAAVERVLLNLARYRGVALPELTDVLEQWESARTRAGSEIGRVFGWAVDQIPFREGEKRLVGRASVLWRCNHRRVCGYRWGRERRAGQHQRQSDELAQPH